MGGASSEDRVFPRSSSGVRCLCYNLLRVLESISIMDNKIKLFINPYIFLFFLSFHSISISIRVKTTIKFSFILI